jgi:hypothetical protein
MSKQELKSKIREAIEKGPLKESIERLSLFGSYNREEARSGSDVDLLVEFSPDSLIGYFSLIELKDYMEREIGLPVDIVTPDSISQYLKEEIIDNADLIYER